MIVLLTATLAVAAFSQSATAQDTGSSRSGRTCVPSGARSFRCVSVDPSGRFNLTETVGAGDQTPAQGELALDEPEAAGSATVTVTPADGLVDHQVVELTGSGYPSDDIFDVEQCPVSAPSGSCDSNRTSSAASDDAGSLRNPFEPGTSSAPVGVSAVIHPITSSHSVDCRVAPGTCELRVLSFWGRELAAAPLDFDPAGPLDGPGTVSLDPDADLTDGQIVTVTADHQRPTAILYVYLCKAGGAVPDPGEIPGDDCANFVSASSENSLVDEAGVLTSEFRVRATLTTAAGELVDCRTTPCEVAVAEEPWVDVPITLPLPLDVDAPLAPAPRIVVQPSSGLAAQAEVDVTGSDWFGNELVLLIPCLHRERPNFVDCSREAFDVARTDADGRFQAPVSVAATGRTERGQRYDCRQDQCELVAFRAETNDNESAVAPLDFADAATPPTAPPIVPPIAVEPRFTG